MDPSLDQTVVSLMGRYLYSVSFPCWPCSCFVQYRLDQTCFDALGGFYSTADWSAFTLILSRALTPVDASI